MSTFHTQALSSSSAPSYSNFPTEGVDQGLSKDFSFLVRTVRQQDLANLSEVLASSFHPQTGVWSWLYPLLRAGIYEDLRTRLHAKTPYHVCLVAVRRSLASPINREMQATYGTGIGDRPIGTVEISLRTHQPWSFPHSRYLYLSNLAVRAEYRRQGIAQQLLQTCERVALDWGFQDLYLHVLENNLSARRLYLKAGYQVQQAGNSIGSLLFGRPRQLLLRKRLVRG
jgi:ribosomal protein S18 acetylase RimI-like enzyme